MRGGVWSGLDEPNKATNGRPRLAAICIKPESLLTTTEAKAKRLRPLAERLITFAKRGDLHARRRVLAVVRDKSVVHVLFTEIGPQYAGRPGGYTLDYLFGHLPMERRRILKQRMAERVVTA